MTELQVKVLSWLSAAAVFVGFYALLCWATAAITGLPFLALVAGVIVAFVPAALLLLGGNKFLDVIDPQHDECPACHGSKVKHQGALIVACPACNVEGHP